MRQVPSGCRSTTWLSQILSKSVRGFAITSSPVRPSLEARLPERLLLAAAVGGRIAGLALALGNARRLAGAAAQVVELGAPHRALAHDLDHRDARRVEREDALHALAIGNLAQREIRIDPGILARDAHALESLGTAMRLLVLRLLLALLGLLGRAILLDHDGDAHRVARCEFRHRPLGEQLLDLFLLERLHNVHGSTSDL